MTPRPRNATDAISLPSNKTEISVPEGLGYAKNSSRRGEPHRLVQANARVAQLREPLILFFRNSGRKTATHFFWNCSLSFEVNGDPALDPFDAVAQDLDHQQIDDRHPDIGLDVEGLGVGELRIAHQVVDGDDGDDRGGLYHQYE